MIPNHSVIVSVTEPKGKNRKKVWFRKSKNLFNIANAKPEWIGCTGNTGSSDATNRTDKIEIKANTDYVFSYEYKTLAGTGNRDICIYDKNLKVLTKANSKVYNPADKQVSIKSSVDGYVDISYDKNCTNIMFERNNKRTSYEIYVEPQIFVRNSNGIYEEFIKKHEEVYSANEQAIGTWIDGKTLYRKVVNLGNLPNASAKSVSTGLSNVNYVKSYGMMTNGSIYFEMNNTRPTDNTTNNETGLYISNNTIYIETKIDRSLYTGFVVLEYTKTN